MRYFRKISGERLYLSPMNPDDAEIYTHWLNDPEVAQRIGAYTRITTLDGERAYIVTAAQEGQNYSIVLNDGDRLIGNISLMDVNHLQRKATLGLFIGDVACRGKGYGTEAIRLILDYGFKWLNLHNIMLEVFANNPCAIACYQKVGFREFGRRTQSAFLNGEFVDDIMMEILPSMFYGADSSSGSGTN